MKKEKKKFPSKSKVNKKIKIHKKESKSKNLKSFSKKKGISSQIQTRIGRSVIIVLAVIAFIVTIMVNNIVNDANDTELSLQSQVVSYQLSEFLAPFQTMTDQLAVNGELQLLIRTISDVSKVAKHSGYPYVLANMQSIQAMDTENIQVVWYADENASMVAQSDGYISEAGWDITTAPWYFCLEKGKTVYTNPYKDSATGKTLLTIASPVFDASGNPLGVAGMNIVMDSIMDKLAGYEVGNNGYIMVVAEDGTIVFHPDSNVTGNNIHELKISNNLNEAITNKTEGLMNYTVDGQAKVGYLVNVGETGYMVISSISSLEYSLSIIAMLLIQLIVFAVGMVVIVFSMRLVAARIVKPLSVLNDSAMKLAEGNLEVDINVTTEDEVGELGRSIGKTVIRLKEYINYIDEISEVLTQIANGKLSIQLKHAYVGEFQKVKEALLHISDSMKEVMTNITESANQVSEGSEDLARAAQGLAEGAELQAASVEELVATTVIVAEQVEANKNDSEKSVVHTKEVTAMMEESQKQMGRMQEAMDKIQEASRKVVGIITTIEDIAEQTNLLSLNASIEAARAGEAGRGFAVVAGEIGKLANESAKAVNVTRELIGVSLSEIEKGDAIAQEVIDSILKSVTKIEEVNVLIHKSAESAQLQMHSVNQIKEGVEEMSQSIQDNTSMAKDTSQISEDLAAQAVNLNQLVQVFELN